MSPSGRRPLAINAPLSAGGRRLGGGARRGARRLARGDGPHRASPRGRRAAGAAAMAPIGGARPHGAVQRHAAARRAPLGRRQGRRAGGGSLLPRRRSHARARAGRGAVRRGAWCAPRCPAPPSRAPKPCREPPPPPPSPMPAPRQLPPPATRALTADRSPLTADRSPPPPPRTKWTRRVPHPVLIGHAASTAR